ncbi:cobalamin biosynthesis protein CobW [Methylosinus sp. Sm6]|uniref:cobalamin biosynthesis protein CobW n=1 Tax=Methylosinus sp. Sm6 TaxID=2866948 RepID=UPI001C99447C|nr:cobalamin biosynthesis protein CobW [Methylosinus sp. Sm6]MBY6240510.1 cobalamin biosynthesis protein CobW [Methylosinus sp. Sm6]
MTKIPATVITGFLGSGKTTLIRHLLQNAGGRRLAVIVNEFGDVGVDGEILRGCGVATGAQDIVELANGCICCTVADDFLPTMAKLLDRETPPEHILIETSGLALPKPLLKAFAWPDVRTRATVDAVIAVIDAAAVAEGRFAADEAALAALRADPDLDHETPLEELFEEQLGSADLIVLNKTDIIDAPRLDRVERDVLAAARPGVGVMRACQGRLDPAALLGLGLCAEDDLDSRPSHHESEADHDHDDFESFVLRTGVIGAAEPLAARLSEIIARHDVLRLKGVVAVGGKSARLIVQAVGPRIETYYDRRWRDDEPRASRLVVIGEKGLARAEIEAALTAALR